MRIKAAFQSGKWIKDSRIKKYGKYQMDLVLVLPSGINVSRAFNG
jgi:hypothetical protein